MLQARAGELERRAGRRSRSVASRIGCGSTSAARRSPRPSTARDAAADGVRGRRRDFAAAQPGIEARRAGRRACPRRRLRGDQHGHGADDGDRARRGRSASAPPGARRGSTSRPRDLRDRARARGRGARPRLARAARGAGRRCDATRHRARRPRSRIWPPRAASTMARARGARSASRTSPALAARLRSLEEMDAAPRRRSATGRGCCWPAPTAASASMGALADYLEVDPRYERAVEAVPRRPAAARGGRAPRAGARRLRAGARARAPAAAASSSPAGRARQPSAAGGDPAARRGAAAGCRPGQRAVRRQPAGGDRRRRLIAELARRGRGAGRDAPRCRWSTARRRRLPGRPRGQPAGATAEARGILAIKREIKDLRERSSSGARRAGRAARRDRPVRHGDRATAAPR